VQAKDVRGWTALMYAEENSSPSILTMVKKAAAAKAVNGRDAAPPTMRN
jgi:hypothetical protein